MIPFQTFKISSLNFLVESEREETHHLLMENTESVQVKLI